MEKLESGEGKVKLLDELLEMIFDMIHGMYEEITEKTGVRIGFSALLPGVFVAFALYLLCGALVDDIAGDALSSTAVDMISVMLVLVALLLTVKWYINRLRYVFVDRQVYESKMNLLKFDIGVFVAEVIYFATVYIISSLCVPYDSLVVMISTPVIVYLLHRLFILWLDSSYKKA